MPNSIYRSRLRQREIDTLLGVKLRPLREYDNRDMTSQVEYLQERVYALEQRIRELESEKEITWKAISSLKFQK